MTAKQSAERKGGLLRTILDRLPTEKQLDEGIELFAVRGWFVTLFDMPVTGVPTIVNLLKTGQEQRADRMLADYFEDAMERLSLSVFEASPLRRTIVERGLLAHRLCLYELSVPVFLAQADGIGGELFGVSPYSRRPDRVRTLREYVESRIDPDTPHASYWQLIFRMLPVNAPTRELRSFHDPLNRHEVLHGLTTEYGTKIKSCQAFAWLHYICSFANQTGMWEKEAQQTDGEGLGSAGAPPSPSS